MIKQAKWQPMPNIVDSSNKRFRIEVKLCILTLSHRNGPGSCSGFTQYLILTHKAIK